MSSTTPPCSDRQEEGREQVPKGASDAIGTALVLTTPITPPFVDLIANAHRAGGASASSIADESITAVGYTIILGRPSAPTPSVR